MSEITGHIQSITKLGNRKHEVILENEETRFFLTVKADMFYNQLLEAKKNEIEATVFTKKLVEKISNNCLGLVIDIKEESI